MKNYFFAVCLISCSFFACNGGGGSTSAPATKGAGSLEGFTLTTTTNSSVERAVRVNAAGETVDEGLIVSGGREGTWLSFYEGRKAGLIKSSTSYVDNVVEGPHLEFDNIGRVELKSFYSKGLLNGPYVKYEYGKPKVEANYIDGKLEGNYKTYYKDGKLQQDTEYKNGQKNGRSVFYNEQEEIIMDYTYKNNEQVSGGQVTPKAAPAKE